MPVVDLNPKNAGTITLGLTPLSVSCQVINFRVEPIQNTNQRAGVYCSPPVNVPGQSSWQISFDYLQDWGTVAGISEFLLDNDAELVPFTFSTADAGQIAGDVYVTAGAFGGDAGTSWNWTGTWPVEGTPVYAAPVVTATAARTKKAS